MCVCVCVCMAVTISLSLEKMATNVNYKSTTINQQVELCVGTGNWTAGTDCVLINLMNDSDVLRQTQGL